MKVHTETSLPRKHYRRWSTQDQIILVTSYIDGVDQTELAELLERTELSIISKLMQIRHDPQEDQLDLQGMLLAADNNISNSKRTDELIGTHVIYAMQLKKITKTYETQDGTKYVELSNNSKLIDFEYIKGSIVKEVYSS